MTNSERLKEELNRIDLTRIIKRLVAYGFKESSVKKAFMRGSISKELAPALEDYTSISALFWMRPDIYKTNGERR